MGCYVASSALAKIPLRPADGDSTAIEYKKAKMTHSASVSNRLLPRTVANAVHITNRGCCRNGVRRGLLLREYSVYSYMGMALCGNMRWGQHTSSAVMPALAEVDVWAFSPELESAAGAPFRALAAFLDLRDFGLLVMMI